MRSFGVGRDAWFSEAFLNSGFRREVRWRRNNSETGESWSKGWENMNQKIAESWEGTLGREPWGKTKKTAQQGGAARRNVREGQRSPGLGCYRPTGVARSRAEDCYRGRTREEKVSRLLTGSNAGTHKNGEPRGATFDRKWKLNSKKGKQTLTL